MTDFEHEHDAPVTDYGQWRREQHYARMQANAAVMAEMLSGGGQAGHQAAHDHITRSTHGIFGAMTPQERGQDVAERQATVGGAWGQERAIERNGGTFDHAIGPAPARADLRYANQPGGRPTGESPLARWVRERD